MSQSLEAALPASAFTTYNYEAPVLTGPNAALLHSIAELISDWIECTNALPRELDFAFRTHDRQIVAQSIRGAARHLYELDAPAANETSLDVRDREARAVHCASLLIACLRIVSYGTLACDESSQKASAEILAPVEGANTAKEKAHIMLGALRAPAPDPYERNLSASHWAEQAVLRGLMANLDGDEYDPRAAEMEPALTATPVRQQVSELHAA